MRGPAAQVLREAVKDQHSNETFEKALGRIVRKHHGTFQDYMDLIAKVRGRAKKGDISLPDAAKVLAAEL